MSLRAGASRKLRADQLLITTFGGTLVRRDMDDVPLWRSADHVPVRTLIEDYAQQLYLDRLTGPSVLTAALSEGVGLLTWRTDTFAYAESFDEASGRYLGLRHGLQVPISPDDTGLILKPDVAQRQFEADIPPGTTPPGPTPPGPPPPDPPIPDPTPTLRRYHGTVRLDPTRVGRDASNIAEAAIAYLTGLDGAEVTVGLEIDARLADEASEHTRRTVTENGRELSFDAGSGFETE